MKSRTVGRCVILLLLPRLILVSLVAMPVAAQHTRNNPVGFDAPAGVARILYDGMGAGYREAELVVGLRETGSVAALDTWVRQHHARVVGWIERLRAARIVADTEDRALKLMELLKRQPPIAYVERNAVIQPLEDAICSEFVGTPPNDTLFPMQWHLENDGLNGLVADSDIDILGAWNITTGSESVAISVIDFGFNLQHPQLAGRFLPGYDFAGEDNDPSGGPAHGTVVSGTIAANVNDGANMCGVDASCKLIPIKVADNFDVAQGLQFAVDSGANIVNMSFIIWNPPQVIKSALDNAIDADIVLVAGAGNSGTNVQFPAKYKKVIAAGWTRSDDTLASGSPSGSKLDVVAPGEQIVGVHAWDDNSFSIVSGSSFATPIVAGIAALLLAEDPSLTADEVFDYIRDGAQDQVGPPGVDLPGWDPNYGYGRVNARRSLELLTGAGERGFLSASVNSVDVTTPWEVDFCLYAGVANGGNLAWLFASLSGVGGPTQVGGALVPLVPDPLFRMTLSNPNAGLFTDNVGALDEDGRRMVHLSVPAGVAASALGMDLTTCFAVYDVPGTGAPVTVSDVVSVTLE